tara:strand:- start:20966 stop:21298 length:333 start_codon:yes stop_codon:yes gene_type:complete
MSTILKIEDLDLSYLPTYESTENESFDCEIELDEEKSLLFSITILNNLIHDAGDYYNPPSTSGTLELTLEEIYIYDYNLSAIPNKCHIEINDTKFIKELKDTLNNHYDIN